MDAECRDEGTGCRDEGAGVQGAVMQDARCRDEGARTQIMQ